MKAITIASNVKWTATWSFTTKVKSTQKNLNTTNYTRTGKGFVIKFPPLS